MKRHFVLLVLFVNIILSCSSWKTSLVSKGDQNDAIQNAIIDFMYTCNLRNNDSIFTVNIYFNNENVLGLSILANRDHKVYPYINDTIGKYSSSFPNKYLLINNKLFYWHDSTAVITQNIVEVLKKYNQIDSLMIDSADYYFMPPYSIDESTKGAEYYFCKDDLRNYKKVITRIAMGSYVPPKLCCKSCKKKVSRDMNIPTNIPGPYTILDIRKEKLNYVIYAGKNDSIFQIVSDKLFL